MNGPKNTDQEKKEAEEAQRMLDFWNQNLSRWTDGAVAEFPSYADLREKYKKGEYILAYYGDTRKIQVQISRDIEKVDLKTMYSIKEHPGQQLVKYLVNLKTTEAFARTGGNLQRAEEKQEWFSRFEKVLRTIYEDDTLTLNFDIETFQFTICQDNREPFNFNAMSMGYAAVFDIVADLMMRMESRRRYDLEGLVLIDEIESHLHVELQRKIMPILMELFPNIQFLLTTHSPFILNSTPNAVVYDLETGKLVDGRVHVTALKESYEAQMTAELITECFEQRNTGIRMLECQTRVDALQRTMTVLYRSLKAYKEDPTMKNLRTVRGLINRNYRFAGFTCTYVRTHINEYPALIREIISG